LGFLVAVGLRGVGAQRLLLPRMNDFTGDEEWHVQVGPSDLKVMSVEQIEDALRLGIIHERTNVWTDGMDSWSALADALGDLGTEELDDVEEIIEPRPDELRTRPRTQASPTPHAPSPLVASASRAAPAPAPLVARPAPSPLVSQPAPASFAPAPLVSQPAPQALAPAPLVAPPPVASQPEADEDDDEIWHVQVSATEVKTMTVDQLDDAFRLDIITGDTKVWTESLGEWLPLREVAGLDDEEEEDVATAQPPVSTLATSQQPPAPAPLVQTSRPPGPAPLVATGRPPGPAPLVPTGRPPGPAPLVPTAPVAVLNSVAPLAMEVPPAPPQKLPNQTFARGLVWAAAVAACFAGLHRNGGSFAAASAAGKVDAYHSAMEKIGGSAASTPVGVQLLIDEAREKYRLDQLSETNPVGSNAPKSTLPEVESEDDDEEKEVEVQPSTSAASSSRKAASAGPSAGARRGSGSPPPFSGGSKKSGKKSGSTNAYDPLNAELP